MAAAEASQALFLGLGILLLQLVLFVFSFDSIPLQDFSDANLESSVVVNGMACKDPKLVEANDFWFSGLDIAGDTNNEDGSNVTPVTVSQLPGLNTLGISMARIDFAPFGINPFHTHPRASELLTVIEGKLLVGLITTSSSSSSNSKSKSKSNRVFTKVVKKGDVFVFPMGLIHFQRNVENSTAVAIVALNSQSPGVISIAKGCFGSDNISDDMLAQVFRVEKSVISKIKSKF